MCISNAQAIAYKEEVEELLVEIEETILEIEKKPDDTEAINRLFRTMHTIKGSGSMFGFNDVANFTHHIETVLDKVRGGSISICKELINLILESEDHIKSMIDAAANGSAINIETGETIIAKLNQFLKGDTEVIAKQQKELEDSPFPEVENMEEITYRITLRPDKGIFEFGTDPATIMDDLRDLGECNIVAHVKDIPPLSDLSPNKCYLFWDIILTTNKGINAIKDIFIFFEDGCELNIDIIDKEYDLTDEIYYKKLGEILVEKKDISSKDLTETLGSQKKIGEKLVDANIVDPTAVVAALAEQEQVQKIREKRKELQSQSSVRVPAERFDSLVDLVGELVTAQARLSQKSIEQNDSELITIAEEVERLVYGLRDNAMSIRMIQIGNTFSSFKRLVRDLSDELGKEIILTTIGGETELDKTVIEQLKDPLVHIIRNSIDHGIEKPEERIKVGKAPQGSIHLSAKHEGGHVSIHIIDDGGGLNPRKLMEKAVAKGLISPDAELTDNEIFKFIFVPGFSTANKVSDVSGRGVGMDVVKKNIESLRGTVSVESRLNIGTFISLKLPLTLAIIDGLMVTIENNYYILPLATVEECVELKKEENSRIKGRNILNVRGEIVPYIRLRDKFGITDTPPSIEHIVITEAGNQRIGFVVDNVIGSHQTVIKSLGPAFKNAHDVSGATILGDGSIALILDVNKLLGQSV